MTSSNPSLQLESWSLNLSSYAPSISNSASKSLTTLSSSNKDGSSTSLLPPGCSSQLSNKKLKSTTPSRTPPTGQQLAQLQSKKAWELATSPTKSIPMNAIMLWMSGNTVQIFSMMAVGMMFTGPFKAVLSINQAFAPYSSLPISTANSSSTSKVQPPSLFQQKAVFLLCQLVAVSLGIYKAWSMGLLPTESSDWLAWREARIPLEFSPLRS